MTDTDRLAEALEEAIRFGIEHEPDYWGGGADDEAYIRTPARKMAAADPTLICPDSADHALAAAVRRWYGDDFTDDDIFAALWADR